MIRKTYTHSDLIDTQGRINAERRFRENDYTGVHFHDYFEIEYINSGDGIVFIDGKVDDLSTGLFYFLSPVNTHNIICKKLDLYHIGFSTMHCDNQLLSSLVYATREATFHLSPEEQSYIRPLMHEMTQYTTNSTYCSMLLNTLLYKISIMLSAKTNTLNEFKYSAPREAVLYIINNFKNNITLKDVADHVGLAPAYFSVLFQNEIGVSFKKYLDSIRFDHAHNLITHTDQSMNDVCHACGFTNYENFVRRFKQHFGYSPREYKKNVINSEPPLRS